MNILNIVPIIKWAGGKRQLMDELNNKFKLLENKNQMTYVEPFLGGASVFLNVLSMDLFKDYIISDINDKLINLYIQVRDNVDEVIDILEVYKEEYLKLNQEDRKEYYYHIRSSYNNSIKNDFYKNSKKSKVENAVMFLFLNKTCFNGLYRENKKGEFNVPIGSYKNPTIFNSEDLYNLSNALNIKDNNGNKRVKILNKDYEFFLNNEIDIKNSFFYLDPPYRPITKNGFNSYHRSDFNDDEQIKLSNFYKKMDSKGAKLLLSNSDPKNLDDNDNFFDNIYSDFIIERVNARRMINSNKSGRGYITELLIRNFN